MFVSHYHLRCISFPRVWANISSSICITYVLLFVPVAFRGSESGKEAHRLSPGCSSRATEEEIRSPRITLHWEELQKLLIRNCKLVWKGAACLLWFFLSSPCGWWLLKWEWLICLGLCALPCAMHREHENISHQSYCLHVSHGSVLGAVKAITGGTAQAIEYDSSAE